MTTYRFNMTASTSVQEWRAAQAVSGIDVSSSGSQKVSHNLGLTSVGCGPQGQGRLSWSTRGDGRPRTSPLGHLLFCSNTTKNMDQGKAADHHHAVSYCMCQESFLPLSFVCGASSVTDLEPSVHALYLWLCFSTHSLDMWISILCIQRTLFFTKATANVMSLDF